MGQENSKTTTPVQKKHINLHDPRSPRENRTPLGKLNANETTPSRL